MQRCLSAVIDCGEPKTLLNGGFEFVSGFENQYQSVIKYHCNHPFYALLGGNEGEVFIYSPPFSLRCVKGGCWSPLSNLCVAAFCSTVGFTCDADRSWRSIDDLIVIPMCLPGIASAELQPFAHAGSELFSENIHVCISI